MPSPKYTKIEITPDAYLALEAEAILQGKTLKKLASELILNGVSDKALDFIQGAANFSRDDLRKLNGERIAKAIEGIGNTNIRINESLLAEVKNVLLKEGYVGAMLYVAQHTASIERDELHRVLTISEKYKLTPALAAEIIKSLNSLESSS